MANAEQLELLRQGVGLWNKMRPTKPDLSGADLRAANLSGAHLSGATDFRRQSRAVAQMAVPDGARLYADLRCIARAHDDQHAEQVGSRTAAIGSTMVIEVIRCASRQ
jgi:hypothetical protein